MKKKTLRELAERAGVEFIRREGRYALIRVADGLGGRIQRVDRGVLEAWLDEEEANEQWRIRREEGR